MAVKPAVVRFYIDADVLGLAKVLARLRSDVTYPGDAGAEIHKRQRPACPIDRTDVEDEVWIPETARQGWLIITRDRAIQDKRAEIAAVRHHSARMVTLASAEAKTVWLQLEVVMCQWRRIEGLLGQAGPFIYSATRTGLRSEPLE
jgi:uncharacterized protein with PIN domain